MKWEDRVELLKYIGSRLARQRVIFHGTNLLVLCTAVFLLFYSSMSWLQQKLIPEPRASQRVEREGMNRMASPSSSVEAARSLQDYQREIAPDLFGAKPEGEDEVSLQDIPLSKQEQHFRLVGTILYEGNRDGIAVIEDTRSNKQEMYKKGDGLEELEIVSILRHNVVLRSPQGDEVALTMKFEDLPDAPTGRSTRAASRERAQTGEDIKRLSRDYVKQSLQNMSQIMQEALIRPYIEDGETVGFQLDNISSGSFFEEIGMQDNDIIMQMDDEQLQDPRQFLDFAQTLDRRNEVDLKIRRDGQERIVTYRLQ